MFSEKRFKKIEDELEKIRKSLKTYSYKDVAGDFHGMWSLPYYINVSSLVKVIELILGHLKLEVKKPSSTLILVKKKKKK